MTTKTISKSDRVLTQQIIGSRRPSNYFWATVVTLGSTGFLLAAISSYLQINLLPVSDATQLIFLPQGLVMGLYGVAGNLLGLYLWLVILWDVGGGYNEFNKETGQVRIFRWGYPGKNRRVDITYSTEDVQAVRVEIKEGLNPRRELYLRVKGRNPIPLSPVGQPLPLSELENQGAELAQFLRVPLEGL